MPTLNINGKRVKVGEEFLSLSPEQQNATVDEIAKTLKAEAPQQEAERAPTLDPNESRDGEGLFEKIDAGVRGAADMLTLGFSDEIAAGFGTGFGLLGDYDEELARQRGIDQFDSENNAGARLTGQVAGGLTSGIGMAKNGATLLTKQALKQGGKQAVARAGVEGSLYSGAYGFGSGVNAEERLSNAGTGALTGFLTGGAVQKVGNSIATRVANRAARKASEAAASSSSQMADEAAGLYQKMRESGVVVKPKALKKLQANVQASLGRTLPEDAPLAHRAADRVGRVLQGGGDLEDLHEASKFVNRSLREAKSGGNESYYLNKIKTVVDAAIENMGSSDVKLGDIKTAAANLKAANQLWGKQKKVALIESIMDSADIRSGQYTQSGMANAIRTEMRQLAQRIRKGQVKGFTQEEITLIRQMAKGGSSSDIVNLFAKFAPRGLLSASIGGGGMAINPALGATIMAGGEVSARLADRAAVNTMGALRNAVATGKAPISRPVNSTIAARMSPVASELMVQQQLSQQAPQNRLLQRQQGLLAR